MPLPLCLVIPAPPRRVLPALARSVQILPEDRWCLRVGTRAVEWRPDAGRASSVPVRFRLEPDSSSGNSLLSVQTFNGSPLRGGLANAVEHVLDSLYLLNLSPFPRHSDEQVERLTPAILVAPLTPTYTMLFPHLERALQPYRFRLRWLAAGELTIGKLTHAIGEAKLVVAAGECCALGRVALRYAQAKSRPAIALLADGEGAPEEPGVRVPYGRGEKAFLQGLDAALTRLVAPHVILLPDGADASQSGIDKEKQRVYREVALDEGAPHIRETDPLRAIETARHLARAGDKQSALLRLAQLASHKQEDVCLAAVDAMAQLGTLAKACFTALVASSSHPSVRLQAARWLYLHKLGTEQLPPTLSELVSQTDDPATAQAAMDLLGRLRGVETGEMLREMATSARDPGMRVRAAELLSQPQQSEALQQAGAQALLALDRPDDALPTLSRLARRAADHGVRHWAALRLVEIGEAALDEIRETFTHTRGVVAGQPLAEALLAYSPLVTDQRHAALWLAEHSNLPRAIEVLTDIALSPQSGASDAVSATNDLNRFAGSWAGAARALATLYEKSPHSVVRTLALDLLVRKYPAEIPLALLLKLALAGNMSAAERPVVMQQLAVLAQPAASRIVEQVLSDAVPTERRWAFFRVLYELPNAAAVPAFIQLSTRAHQSDIRYAAAEQLIARSQQQMGYAALAALAVATPEWLLRERALYELAQGLPSTALLLRSVIERTRYGDTSSLARELLRGSTATPLQHTRRRMDTLGRRWNGWVATLPLGWLDRAMGRMKRKH